MPSNRWLKSVNPPQEKAKEEPTPNVSMREVRRLQQEKTGNKEVTPARENTEIKATPSRPSRGSTSPAPSKAAPDAPTPANAIAPERDFTRVANSIIRDAVPSGLFAGKRKQLYDFLYSQTRGAVVPTRTVRISKERLMKGADIGSEVTLRQNLTHLKNAGLLIERVIGGSRGGNEYEVFLPEEVAATPSRGGNPLYPLYTLYFLEGLEALETRASRGGLNVENTDTSASPKTLYKTNTRDDDEAFARFLDFMAKVNREITGRAPSAAEAEKWGELAEVLITELKIAAGRTTVSSVPAFLAEHLRRRLWKKEKRQIEAEGAASAVSAATPNVDPAQCPDCYGTGMWYPQGYDRGVARCRHEKLSPGTEEAGERAG